MSRKSKGNPHCPVPGCKTDKPHVDDPVVGGMLKWMTPAVTAQLACSGMAELAHSFMRDVEDNKLFAWFTRLRQVEELYIRSVYALLLASPQELPHLISGALPNNFTTYYRRINEDVFDGRGALEEVNSGLMFGSFRAIDTLNDGAHTSFLAFATCFGLARHPEDMRPDFAQVYAKHLNNYCARLNYMHGMFNAGKSKAYVLAGVRQLHKP